MASAATGKGGARVGWGVGSVQGEEGGGFMGSVVPRYEEHGECQHLGRQR